MRRITTAALALCAVAHAQTSRRGGDSPPAKTSAGAKTSTPPAKPSATGGATPASLPAVTELDLEGLKKLLARGDDPAKAKPLLVNFWATWCDPCRAEFPDLVKINEDYKGRGLEFASVSGDDVAEIKTSVPQFLQQMHAGMTPYLLNVPDMGEAINLVDPAWGGELPATYLYDRTGKVVFKHFGRVDPKELRAALDKVLAAN
ncbi:MAG: redoxin domain-containing protein [Acidobacteriota bacterium]|nr:redoxin domain-containing protein [Acidobacteriota bacterium]